MRALVTGGRYLEDSKFVFESLDFLNKDLKIKQLCHGGAKGADNLAGQWAGVRGIPTVVMEAEWDRHGRAAGPIRNADMLSKFKPDVVIAFPGGKGTADMVRRAEVRGVRVILVGKEQN